MRVDPDQVTAIIREVAAIEIMPFFRKLKTGDIAYKIGDDPVTIADKASESALEARLLDLLPGSKAVGEEAFALNPGILEHFSGESPVWIIDPIDGTRNFVAGSEQFGVIIALAERNQTVAGWLYSPTSDEVITAEVGSGAWHKGKRLKTLPPESLANMTGYLGDRLLGAQQLNATDVHPHFDLMKVGVMEYAELVIDGPQFGSNKKQRHFRATLLHATPWDDAAGVLIHHEAGGYAAFWDETPYRPNIMHRGLAIAPDEKCWHALKNWCETFIKLPMDQ